MKSETALKIRGTLKDFKRLKSLPRGNHHWNWNNNATVLAIHKRIHRTFGKASLYKCVDCKRTARDWSLKKGCVYSSNLSDFEPRCRKCHILIDGNNNLKKLWEKRKSL
jgi:hypothetical protein